MPNIRVDIDYTIKDGTEIKFRSPVDCSQITGLIVYYPGTGGNIVSKVFALADAHGNNVGNIDHLFAEAVVVKVILDVTKGMAFVQNADTNKYIEENFLKKGKATASDVGAVPSGYALGNSGNQTLTNGSLIIKDEKNVGRGYEIDRTINGTIYGYDVGVNQNGVLVYFKTGDEVTNQMVLSPTNTRFTQPVNIGSGGTGATTAADARTNLGAAPSGYGLGSAELFSVSNVNSITNPGWYYCNENGKVGDFTSNRWWMHVKAYGTGSTYCTQEMHTFSGTTGFTFVRHKLNGTWTDWKSAYQKDKLWENASLSSAFNAQTISLNLSEYDGIEVLYYVDETTNVYQNTGYVKVGLPCVMWYATADSGYRLHRNFTVSTTGIKFETAKASSGATVSSLCKPYQIFGIKGVK